MPAALQCYNSSGNLQIDTQFMNMVLVQSGYLTINTSATPPTSWSAVTVSGLNNPIICCTVSGGAGYTVPFQVTYSVNPSTGVGSHTFYIASYLTSGSINVAYYIYDKQPNVVPSFGLVTWTSGGVVSFSSNYEPMRIVNMVNIPYGTPNEGYTPSTYTISGTYSGQKLAVAFTNPKSYITSDPYGSGVGRVYFQDAYSNNTGSTPYVQTSTYIPVDLAPSNNIGFSQPIGGQLFAVDVTNVYLP